MLLPALYSCVLKIRQGTDLSPAWHSLKLSRASSQVSTRPVSVKCVLSPIC